MIIHDCMQGSSRWLQLRAGIPTASKFDEILTPKGEKSKSQERYRLTLLAERLMGHPVVEHVSEWMQRGSEQEKEAVLFYEFQTGLSTAPVGFVTNDAGTIGASPDRLVGKDGLLEIKVPSEWIHMSYLLNSGSQYEAYKIQVQGQMWISGRAWADVLSWHPELPPALVRVHRDEDFIARLEGHVAAFSEQLEREWAELKDRGWAVAPRSEREPTLSEIMRDALIETQSRR